MNSCLTPLCESLIHSSGIYNSKFATSVSGSSYVLQT